MSRKVLYRAKEIETGQWIEGSLVERLSPDPCIVPKDYKRKPSEFYIAKTGFADWNMPRPIDLYQVIPETIGRFTGVMICGKALFEGDVLRLKPKKGFDSFFEVFWSDTDFSFRVRNSLVPCSDGWGRLSRLIDQFIDKDSIETKIVGNRIDNPELMGLDTPILN